MSRRWYAWFVFGSLSLAVSTAQAATSVEDLVCSFDCSSSIVSLTWTNTDAYTSIDILRDGNPVATLAGIESSFQELASANPAGYSVIPSCGVVVAPPVDCEVTIAAIDGVSCHRDCSTGAVEISWTNGGSYDAIEIYEDLILIATVPGSQTTFATVATTVTDPSLYEIRPICGALSTASIAGCAFGSLPLPYPDHLILDLEGPGGTIDSVGTLEGALTMLGESFATVRSLSELPCDAGRPLTPGGGKIVWSMTGTFPDNTPMNPELGQFLVDQITNAGGVYHEGNDTWGFDPPTVFADFDGVGVATDGDDSLTEVVGADLLAVIVSPYTQDQPGNDSNDRLTLSTTDL
ncbi:MAG: hypothetical protein KDC38_20630, partial [Planctomycetes bacterium]|nr:hypothetical protein [Planctomycetota bacterium]